MNLVFWGGMNLLINLLFAMLQHVLFVSLTRAAIKLVKDSMVVLGGIIRGITGRIVPGLGCFVLVSAIAKNPSKMLWGVEGCFRGLYVKCFKFLPPFLLSRASFSTMF